MKNFLNYIKEPFSELGNIRNLTLCAILIAINVVFSLFSFYVTTALKFSFAFLFATIIAMKFGPVIAGFSAALADIIQYLIKPVGPYQPLLTLSCALMGIIYGIFLYKNKTQIWRIIVSRVINSAVISTLLDSYFISILYGKVFREYLTVRAVKNLILLPAEIIITVVVIQAIKKIESRQVKTK